MSASAPSKPAAKRLWIYRLVLLLVAPVVVLGGLELTLRLVGFGYDPRFLVKDEEDGSMLRDNYQFAWRFFPESLARTPQPIRVRREKPEGVHRIVVLGGSAAMGDPQPSFGLVRVLECLLEHRFPQKRFEVINAAVTAINSHVVLPIAKDCEVLDADLWVVYMGNNEVNGPYGSGSVFGAQRPSRSMIRASLAYQRTRLGQWMASFRGAEEGVPKNWGGLKMFLDQQVKKDDPDLERVYANFEGNLKAILQVGESAGVPVVLSTVAVNLEDSAPFLSQEKPSREEMVGITAMIQSERWPEAQAACALMLERYPNSAIAHFCHGKILAGQGNKSEARAAFERACDLDTLRFRADSRLNAIVRGMREGPGVHFVDSEARLSTEDANGIPGEEFFHEHVHLTFDGSYHLAHGLAMVAEKALGLAESSTDWLSKNACAEAMGLTVFHRREILREMIGRLGTPPFDGQWGHRERLAELNGQISDLGSQMNADMGRRAMAYYGSATKEAPKDWQTRQNYAALLGSTGKLDQAAAQWKAVVDQIPHDPSSWYQLGAAWNRAKKWGEGEEALREAIRLRERHPKAWNSLGIALSRQSRFEESYRCFQAAIDYAPHMAEALMNWGLVLQNQKQPETARTKFEQAIVADARHLPSYVQLGQNLTKSSDFDRAAKIYGEVVKLAPRDPGARLNLALVYAKLGKRAAAVTELQECLRLDPLNELAQRYLQQLR